MTLLLWISAVAFWLTMVSSLVLFAWCVRHAAPPISDRLHASGPPPSPPVLNGGTRVHISGRHS